MADQATSPPAEQTAAAAPPPFDEERKRLANILRKWGGLVPSVESKKLIAEKLPEFAAWLAKADPATMLRVTQVLLADTDVPGVHNRRAVQQILDKLDSSGVSLGGQAQDVRYLQALLLATWPYEGKVFHPRLIPVYLESAFAIAAKGGPDAETITTWQQMLRELVWSLPPRTDILVQLLWWGQAQYCSRARIPYCKLERTEQVVFFSAFEIAQYALVTRAKGDIVQSMLPVEPSAAYLTRHLQSLKLDVDKTNSLYGWLESIYTELYNHDSPAIHAQLNDLAEEDALGLPVTWVRRLASARSKLPPKPMAKEALGLDVDTSLSLEEFATLLLRELMLDTYLGK